MRIQDLFNAGYLAPVFAGTSPARRSGVEMRMEDFRSPGAAAPEQGATSVFLTPQTLVSFPVASLVVSVMWKIVQSFAAWGGANVVAFVIAMLIGALIFVISVSDERVKLETTNQKIIAVAIAVLNSCYLYAAAVGITVAITQ